MRRTELTYVLPGQRKAFEEGSPIGPENSAPH
jgi:hypothetical protein